MKKVISIEGMRCGHCTASVDKALREIAGVSDVTVDLAAKKAEVEAADTVTDEDVDSYIETNILSNFATDEQAQVGEQLPAVPIAEVLEGEFLAARRMVDDACAHGGGEWITKVLLLGDLGDEAVVVICDGNRDHAMLELIAAREEGRLPRLLGSRSKLVAREHVRQDVAADKRRLKGNKDQRARENEPSAFG